MKQSAATEPERTAKKAAAGQHLPGGHRTRARQFDSYNEQINPHHHPVHLLTKVMYLYVYGIVIWNEV